MVSRMKDTVLDEADLEVTAVKHFFWGNTALAGTIPSLILVYLEWLLIAFQPFAN